MSHRSCFATLRRATLSLAALLPALLFLSALTAPPATATPPLTYTGQLLSGGSPIASGLYDLKFSLYTAATGGTQVGSTLSLSSVPVEDGVFVATLDFGSSINGQTLYLQTSYRPHPSPGGTPYTTPSPRPLVPTAGEADYAAVSGSTNALQGKGISTTAPTTGQVLTYNGTLWTPTTFSGGTTYTAGNGLTLSGTQFSVAVPLTLSGSSSNAIVSATNTGSGIGVYGSSATGYSGYFKGAGGTALYGETTAAGGTGVVGVSSNFSSGDGVEGYSHSGYGVYGSATGAKAAVYGFNAGSDDFGFLAGTDPMFSAPVGVFGSDISDSGGHAVEGISTNGEGVYGNSMNDIAVRGESNNGFAAVFNGNVNINQDPNGDSGSGSLNVAGDFSVSGNKNFKIDHPLHPDTMTLKHACVESNLPENVYNGKVVTDAQGNALVTLPDYFGALNKNPLYQLTVVGQFAQAVVAAEVKNNQFTIKTDKPGVTVCWQVTGERNDAYQKMHPYQAEEQKAEKDQGKYLDPASYGLPTEMGIGYAQRQAHTAHLPR